MASPCESLDEVKTSADIPIQYDLEFFFGHSLPLVRLLQLADLLNPSRVAAPFEFGLEPDLDHAVDQAFAQHVGRETQHIQIIVPPAHLGRQVVVARGSADAGELVRGDRHTDARAADQNPAFGFPLAHGASNVRGDIGVIDTAFFIGTFVDRFVAELLDEFEDLDFDLLSAMVAADDDFHLMLPILARRVSEGVL